MRYATSIIGLADGSLFAFAGLWERWKDPSGSALHTCTILTSTPNSLVREIHDRMAVILRPEDYELWLDPGVTNPADVGHLLKAMDARDMASFPVGSAVNRVQNDGPECSEQVTVIGKQPSLNFS